MGRLTDKKREKLISFCVMMIALLVLLFMSYLFPCSLFRTTGMSTGAGKGEIVTFNYDNFFLNLITLSVSCGCVYLVYKLGSGISLKTCLVVLSVWVLCFGLLFVASAKLQPTEDSYIVTFFARQAAKGDYSYYHEYFEFFPYQLGYVLYAELFFRLFNILMPGVPTGFSSLALQGMNVVFVLMAYISIVNAVGIIFRSETVQKLTALLLAACLPPLFMSTFMYGNVPALAFSCAASWMFISFIRDGCPVNGILCAVFLSVAVLLKLNSMIFFVAIIILWLLSLIKKPTLTSSVLLIVTVLMVLAVKPMPQKFYEARCEHEFGSGIPLTGWLAMGLHEGQSCSGWYDTDFTTNAFTHAGKDPDAASEIALEGIKSRLDYFMDEPVEALRFFGRKFLSQWNEPSYQSIWTNKVRTHYSEPSAMYNFFCNRVESAVMTAMKLYQQMVFFGFTLGLVGLLFRRDIPASLFPLVILGGMLYHLLFEGKSQYVMSYFVLMVPIAAYGYRLLFRRLQLLDEYSKAQSSRKNEKQRRDIF